MSRIRTIKPEFWTSEQVVDCSPIARLFFVGIWNFCDDHGVHPASIRRLKMQVFPADRISDDAIQAMIDELLTAGLLRLYEVHGKGYLQVTGWTKHQKIEKPTYRHPLPEPTAQAENSSEPPRMVGEQSPSPRREVGEQSASRRPRNGMEWKGSKPLSGAPDAIVVLDYLNEKTGRAYKPVKANIVLITGRLRESTVEQCCSVIDAKVAAWQHDPKMCEYLRPATLFNATKFASYVGELGTDSSGSVKDWE